MPHHSYFDVRLRCCDGLSEFRGETRAAQARIGILQSLPGLGQLRRQGAPRNHFDAYGRAGSWDGFDSNTVSPGPNGFHNCAGGFNAQTAPIKLTGRYPVGKVGDLPLVEPETSRPGSITGGEQASLQRDGTETRSSPLLSASVCLLARRKTQMPYRGDLGSTRDRIGNVKLLFIGPGALRKDRQFEAFGIS